MAKKLSGSSQPARLKSVNSENIKSRRLTKRESQAFQGIAARRAAEDDSRIKLQRHPTSDRSTVGSGDAIPRCQTAEEGSQRASG
jgi:hypothetical protein